MAKNAFTIQKSKLEKAISMLQNAVNKKYTIDITSNILFESTESSIILKATENELISMKLKIKPDSIDGKINCAVNAESLNNIMKSLSDGEVIVELDKEYLLLKQKGSKFKLPIFDSQDYEFPFREDYQSSEYEKIQVDNALLQDTLRSINHCCTDKENAHIAFQGVFFGINEGKQSIVSTDGKRLAYLITDYDNKDLKLTSLIPKKSILEINKIFNNDFELYIKRAEVLDDEDDEDIDKDSLECIAFISEEVEFYTRMINAKFPSFKEVVDNRPKIAPLNIEREKLLKALQKVNALCTRIKITLKPNEIIIDTLEGINNASGSIDIQDITLNLEKPLEIGIVNKHLLECIANTKAEEIDLYIDETHKPFYFDLKEFQEIIMPQYL